MATRRRGWSRSVRRPDGPRESRPHRCTSGQRFLRHVIDDEAKIEAIGKSKYYSELATWYLYRHLSSPNSALGIDMKAVDTVVGNLLWLATRDRSFDEHVLAVARCRAAADVLQRVGKETEQARLTVDETYRGILALGPKRIPTEKLNSLRLMVSECPPNAQDVRQCVVDVFETRRQDPNSRVREIARLGLEDLEDEPQRIVSLVSQRIEARQVLAVRLHA